MTPKTWKVVSFNVNGIRASFRKGLLQYIEQEKPTVLGLQESRASLTQFPAGMTPPRGYRAMELSTALKAGYSGTVLYARVAPVASGHTLGLRRFDDEGRVTWMEFETFVCFNVYFPKGSGAARDNSRVPYKRAFYKALFSFAQRMGTRTGKALIIMGDFNTAHQDIDLRNPRSNVKNSGFLPVERKDLDTYLRGGFADTFRALNGDRVQYSWWSNLPGARERNVGWRIDYVWASNALLPSVRSAFIHDHVCASDHCPVGIRLRL